ncbi:hypothetical protein [Castellaniella sp.]|uniref:hypothetical protein n=1 Tax=Castellaniella sp. TaxID=1955812 RepID=UPI002AFEB1C7|nr:hypothetical protein [Castellaniella sp.]
MNESLTPQVIAALLGGAVGSVRNFTRKGEKPRLTEGLMNLLVGEIFAAAAGVYFTGNAHVAMAAVVGLGAGAVGSYALDALQASIPEGVKLVVTGWAERMGGKQKDEET